MVKINIPLIVKPADTDDSLGVSLVEKKQDLQKALDKAFQHGKRVVIEEFIAGREIRVAVVPWKVIHNIDAPVDDYSEGGYTDDDLFVTPFLEYLIPKDVKIRTQESKYNYGNKGVPTTQNTNTFDSSRLPAVVSKQLSEELITQAKKAFIAIQAKHYMVFDFRIRVEKHGSTKREAAYLLEACPSAGFSPQSIVVRMANTSVQTGGPDLTYPRLFVGVLKTAVKEFRKSNEIAK